MALQFQPYMVLVAIGIVFAPIYVIACFVSCFKAISDRKRIVKHNIELRQAKEEKQRNGGVNPAGRGRGHSKKPNIQFIVDEDRQKKWGLAPATDSSRSKEAAENGDNYAIENHHSENHTVENHHNTNNVRSRAEGRSGGGPKCDVVQVTVEQHRPVSNGAGPTVQRDDRANEATSLCDVTAANGQGLEMETFCIDEDAPRRISTHRNSFPVLATPPVLNVNSLDTCASPGHQPTTTVFGSEPLYSPRALGTVHSAPDAPLQLPKTSTSSSRVSDDSEGETSPKHTSSHYNNNNPEPSSSKTTSDSHEYMQQTNSSVRHTDRSANEKHKPNGKHSNSRENVHLNLQDRGRRKHMTKSSSLSKEESQSGSRDLDKRSHSANSTNVNGSEKRDMNGQKPADRHRQHCKHNRSAESRRNSSSSVSNSVTSSRSNVNSHCDKCSLGDVTSSSSSNHAAHASSRGENRDRRGRRSNSRQSSRDSSKEDVQKLACVEVDDENSSPSPQGNVNIGFVNSNDETTPTALQQQYVGF